MLTFITKGIGQGCTSRTLVAFMLALSFTLFGRSALPSDVAGGAKRVALVIANVRYPGTNSQVGTASRDAHLLTDELKRDRFEVALVEDASKAEMLRAFVDFVAKLGPGATALIYFNGIGIQFGGQSFLMPIDARIESEEDVGREGTSIDAVLQIMNRWGADVKIIIVDAARTNAYEGRFRAFSAGLADLNVTEGTLALYAITPGKVSSDDTRNSGMFMNELLRQLRTPGLSAEEILTRTRVGVSHASEGKQIPWVSSSLAKEFYFGKVPTSVVDGATRSSLLPGATQPRVESQNHENPSATPSHQPGSAPNLPPPNPGTSGKNLAAIFRDCADCPELTILPGGHFEMGAGSTPFDRPVHRVTIPRPFAMSRYEITLHDWELCFSGLGCKYRPDVPSQGNDNERPAVNVSWLDAKEYVLWLAQKTGRKYRLPSEAEWEYGARGGTTSAFAWGTTVGTSKANCRDCQAVMIRQTLPVGHFPPNRFGLFDMAGNAAEWVEDCWHESYRGAPDGGSAWESENCAQRVLRGGSFDSTSAYVKPFARFRYDADVRYYANGFRIVRDLD